MKIVSFFLFCLSLPFVLAAQNRTLSGYIINAETKEPVTGVNVFVSGSVRGTNTGPEGYFKLPGLTENIREVIFSHVSFQTLIYPLSGKSLSMDVTIALKPVTLQLHEVAVKGTADKTWKKNFRKFETAFLGTSQNAAKCTIENSWVIDFQKDDGGITAIAGEMNEIKNEALGYRIHFLLTHFSAKGLTVSYAGKFRFEEMTPENVKQEKKWSKEREKAYYGSLRHFLKTLTANRLLKEGFIVHFAKLNNQNEFEITVPVMAGDIVTTDEATGIHKMRFRNFIRVLYTKEGGRAHTTEATPTDYQTSYLFLVKPVIQIYPGGITPDREYIQEYGYWSENRIAELLPLEYFPEN